MSVYYKKPCIFCLRFNKLEIQANCSATYMCIKLHKIYSMMGVLQILEEKMSWVGKWELGLGRHQFFLPKWLVTMYEIILPPPYQFLYACMPV